MEDRESWRDGGNPAVSKVDPGVEWSVDIQINVGDSLSNNLRDDDVFGGDGGAHLDEGETEVGDGVESGSVGKSEVIVSNSVYGNGRGRECAWVRDGVPERMPGGSWGAAKRVLTSRQKRRTDFI